MFVSVIVPIYNVEEYLPNCIRSILSQTYSDFELILVDDGSLDSSYSICESYAKIDSRIKVVHQNNAGLSAARNTGIENAKGEYLTFIDSDDFVQSCYLEVLVKGCKEYQADLSVCSFIRCLSNDTIDSVRIPPRIENFDVFSDERMKVFLTTQRVRTSAWAKLYRKSLFDTLRFPVGKYNEDEFTTYLAIHLANKVVISNYKGYVYRYNKKSIMNESFSPKKMHGVEGCLKRMTFIEKEYPELKKYAYRAVIYACNQVVLSMGRSKVTDTPLLEQIQLIYRKYTWYYITTRSAVLGKFFSLLSFVSVRFAVKIVAWLR